MDEKVSKIHSKDGELNRCGGHAPLIVIKHVSFHMFLHLPYHFTIKYHIILLHVIRKCNFLNSCSIDANKVFTEIC